MKNYPHSKAAQLSMDHKKQKESKIQPSTMGNIPIDSQHKYQINTGCSWCTLLWLALAAVILIGCGALVIFFIKEIILGAILAGIGVIPLIILIGCLYRKWSAAKNNKQLLTEIVESNARLSKLKRPNRINLASINCIGQVLI